MDTVFSHVTDWLHHPFATPLDTLDVFLLVGIVLIAIVAWNLVLYHIRMAVTAV